MSLPAIKPFPFEEPGYHHDPYSIYDATFKEGPVVRTNIGVWMIGGHAEVRMCQGDRRFASDFTKWSGYGAFAEGFWGGVDSPIARLQKSAFVFADGEKHSRLRRLVSRAFSARAIEGLRPFIAETIDRLFNERDSVEVIDVVNDLALPLSTTVISTLLGIPEADRSACRDRAVLIGRAFGPPPMPDVRPSVEAAIADANAYFIARVDERRQAPGDDLLSALATVEENGDRLSSDEIVATANLLFGAGHETTTALIGNAAHALTQFPDQFRLLREGTVSVDAAVEEFLRYDTPFQLMRKVTVEPVEISGFTIPADSMVLAFIGAGNHDGKRFENPHKLDLNRTDVKTLSFGFGPHHCLGAALARSEACAVLDRLVSRTTRLEVADSGPTRLPPAVPVRGFEKLPVLLG